MRRHLVRAALIPSLLALAALGCDDGAAGDPLDASSPAPPMPQTVSGDVAAGVVLRWQNHAFENAGDAQRLLADQPVGSLVPVVDGRIDLGPVEPPFGIYHRLCDQVEPDRCDAELRALQDGDAFALAALATTDAAAFDCTFADLDGCDPEGLVHAPTHLLVFAREDFDPAGHPLFDRAGIAEAIPAGVHLMRFRDKRDAELLPLDGEAIEFTAGGAPPNIF